MTFAGSPCHRQWKMDKVGSEVYTSIEGSRRQPQTVSRSRTSGPGIFSQGVLEVSLTRMG